MNNMDTYFADIHIHIGRDCNGQLVKISASKHLTLQAIMHEANKRKGIDIVGIIDCHAPNVLREIEQCINEEIADPLENGGIRFNRVTLLLGSEIEVYDESCRGPIHVLCF